MKNEKYAYTLFVFHFSLFVLELRTIHTSILRSAYQVNHGEFKSSVTPAALAQAGCIDIIAEPDSPV